MSFLAKPLTNPFPVPLYLVVLSQVEQQDGEAKQVSLFSAWPGSFALFGWRERYPNLGRCTGHPSGSIDLPSVTVPRNRSSAGSIQIRHASS